MAPLLLHCMFDVKRSEVKVKDAKMPKSFFSAVTSPYGPVYFTYRSPYSSETGMPAMPRTADFLDVSVFTVWMRAVPKDVIMMITFVKFVNRRNEFIDIIVTIKYQ